MSEEMNTLVVLFHSIDKEARVLMIINCHYSFLNSCFTFFLIRYYTLISSNKEYNCQEQYHRG